MRLNRLALALVAVSSSWAALANPAINSNVSGSIAGAVGATAIGVNTATQLVAGQNQARLEGGLRSNLGTNLNANLNANLSANLGPHRNGPDALTSSRSSLTGASLSGSAPRAVAMDESIPRGWLMALVAVLLIGHQLRRKHRFLRPHRFSDL